MTVMKSRSKYGNAEVNFRCLHHLASGVVALRAFQSTAAAFWKVYGINWIISPVPVGRKKWLLDVEVIQDDIRVVVAKNVVGILTSSKASATQLRLECCVNCGPDSQPMSCTLLDVLVLRKIPSGKTIVREIAGFS